MQFTTLVLWDVVKLILAIILLFFFPIGTIVSLFIFYHLYSSGKKLEKVYDDHQSSRKIQLATQEAKAKEAARNTKYGKKLEILRHTELELKAKRTQNEIERVNKQIQEIKANYGEMIIHLQEEAKEINKLPHFTCTTGFSREEPIAFNFSINKGYASLSLRLTVNGTFTADSSQLGSLTSGYDLPDAHNVSEEAKLKLEKLFLVAIDQMDEVR